MVIKIANEGKTTRQIASEVHVSLRTIGLILNRVTGDDEDNKEQGFQPKSEYAQAFKMFKDGRPLEDVAIELDIETPTVLCYYDDFLKLLYMRRLVSIYNELKGDLSTFLDLYRRIKEERLSKQQITELLKTPNLLSDLKERVNLYNDHLRELHTKKVRLEREIKEKVRMLSAL